MRVMIENAMKFIYVTPLFLAHLSYSDIYVESNLFRYLVTLYSTIYIDYISKQVTAAVTLLAHTPV